MIIIARIAAFLAVGSILLLFLTILVYRTGMVHATRDEKGHLKKKQSLKGFAILFSVLVLIISFFTSYLVSAFSHETGFLTMLLWNSFLMLLLLIFDSLIVDILIIGIIRPGFLRIPEETTIDTMKIHVLKTITLGWIFILPIIGISTTIAWFILK